MLKELFNLSGRAALVTGGSKGIGKAVARGLARQGKLVVLRHNKPADPEDFKGVYRLRLPLPGDPVRTIEVDEAAGDGE